MTSGLVYLDSSAIVRLILEEPDWEELVAFIGNYPGRVTSALSMTEVRRAIRRAAALPDALLRGDAVLARIDQVAVSSELLRRASDLEPPTLRTLDAIHVATALELAPIAAFVTYDVRQAQGARANGLRVEAPK